MLSLLCSLSPVPVTVKDSSPNAKRRVGAQAYQVRRAIAAHADALAEAPVPSSEAERIERTKLAMALADRWERIQRRIEQSPQHQYRKRMKAKLAAAAKGLAPTGEVRPKTLRKPKTTAPTTPDPRKEPSAGEANPSADNATGDQGQGPPSKD